MLQTITTEFIDKFYSLKDKIADIYIKHILYGTQKNKRCVLCPFVDEDRIGLIINDEELYITTDELRDVYIDQTGCYLKSDVMELYINYIAK